MDFIFRAAEKFMKDHKRLMRYRRIFAILAAVVVFATTYALILPAITIDRQRAAETPGMEVGVAEEEIEETEESSGPEGPEDTDADEEAPANDSAETQDSQDESADSDQSGTSSDSGYGEDASYQNVEEDPGSAEDYASRNSEEDSDSGYDARTDTTLSDDASDDGSANDNKADPETGGASTDSGTAAISADTADAAAVEEQTVEYPVTLTFDGGGYIITATFDETACLPAGVSLDALEILPDTTYKNDDDITVYADYGEYYSRTLETLEKANCLEDQTISSARFFDIKFVDSEGFIVEPAAAVSIAVQYGDPLSTRDTLGTVAVHFDDVKIEDRDREDVPEIGKARVIETANEFGRDDIETVSFEAETFSVYAIVGTAPGTPVNMTAGTTETITPDYPSGVTGAKYQYYTWTSSDASVVSIQSGNNDSSAAIKAEKAGSATVTLNYKYGKKEKDATSGKAVFAVTVTEAEDPDPGSGGDPDPLFTDQEATAQEGTLTDAASGGMTVTVKETGRLKKLSDYHVVVEDAADEYADDADMLRAYHIYLADESGKEITDLEKDLKNSQNLSLRVTITYDEEQEWFDQAKDIKHHKNGEEQTINGVTFGKDKKTISFNVRGFSDFVFVKNPGSAQPGEGGVTTGDGEKYLLSKTAASTGTENEYEITLKVNPSITWPRKQVIVPKSFEEILASTGVSIRNNNNDSSTGVYDSGLTFTGTQDIYNWAKTSGLGGANGGLLVPTESLAEQYTTNANKLYEVTSIAIGSTVVNLNSHYYVYLTSFSNNSTVWMFPNGKYIKLDVKFHQTQQINSKHFVGTISFENAKAETWVLEAAAEYVAEEDIGNFTNATIAKPTSVSDLMGSDISFLNFTRIDGTATTSNPAVSSYSKATETEGNPDSINWEFQSALPANSSSTYTTSSDGKTYYLTSSAYELKYKIRLDVQNSGFVSTNPNGGTETWYDTNGTTTLTAPEGNQTFEVPQVAGILYDLKLKKVDDVGDPVEGAVFAITGSGNNGAVTYGSTGTGDTIQYDKTAASDDNGVVTFSGLPWGTYSIVEVSAPAGYIKDNSANKSVTLCYTTNPDSLVTSDVSGQTTHLMYENWENDFKFKNRKTHVAVRKADADDSSALENVTLFLYKKNGNRDKDFYTASTDQDGYAYWDAVPPGEYTLEEANAPSGYVSIPPTEITISEDGSVTVTSPNSSVYIEESQQTQSHNTIDYPLITAKDEPIRIAIKKVDGDGNVLTDETATPLAGFSFKISDSDNNYAGTIDGSNGSHPGYFLMEKVPAGTYTLKETAVPTGYKAVDDAAVTVNSDGTLSFSHNDLEKTNETIAGKKYQVIKVFNRKSAVKVVLRKTDESGYTCRTENEQIVDTTNYLPGAVFSLKKADGTAVEGAPLEPASDQNGFITSAEGIDLESGTYKLTEDTPPEGYNALTGDVIITVKESGDNRVTAILDQTTMDYHVEKRGTDTYTVYITNNPGVELPHTGGTGFLSPQALIGIMAMAFVLAAGIMYSFSERRGERRSM